MRQLDCPYLHCEKTGFRRVGLDLGESGPLRVDSTWYCCHPFHGVRLELGDARLDVEQHCDACGLPREPPPEDVTG